MMLARVSHVEAFRKWQHWRPLFEGQQEPTLAQVVASIVTDHPTEAMKAGSALHHALELAADGRDYETLTADGYTFRFSGGEIEMSPIRELRMSRAYGGLTITGKADCVIGRKVIDHKTTAQIDLERYLEGYSWRYYLEIFGADCFEWNVFEMQETEARTFIVDPPQKMSAYRYPEISADCADLAAEYLKFARQHLPAGFDPLASERMAA